MTVRISERFGSGGANMVPQGAQGLPTMAEALRQVADDLAAMNTRQISVQAKLDTFIAAYNAHRGVAGVHVEADSANGVAATPATDPTVDILALLNDAVTQYEAHRILTAGGVHGAADSTNVITATNPATDEAEAIALANDLKAMYEAHRVLIGGGEHGAADNTNTIASANATDWDSVVTLINEFKNTTGYEDHRVLIGGGEHGAADSTNVITAADAGGQVAALTTEINEMKADFNNHSPSLGLHPNAGGTEATADMSTEATGFALANALKATLNTHMVDADVHLDAGTLAVAVADATGYEDIIPLVVDIRAKYTSHIAKTTVHSKADAGNAETVLGTGAEVTIGLVKE